MACFFLNALFAFSITRPPPPKIRPAYELARSNLRPILASGAVVGVLLAVATTIAPRWGSPWFALALGAS